MIQGPDPAPPVPVATRPADPVRAIMRAPLATVDKGDSLRHAAAELAGGELGALLVSGEHGGADIAGIVSERDVVAAVAAGAELDDVQVRDLMTTETITVTADDTVRAAAEAMLEAGVRHIPVLHHGHPVGMLSIRDLLDVFLTDGGAS